MKRILLLLLLLSLLPLAGCRTRLTAAHGSPGPDGEWAAEPSGADRQNGAFPGNMPEGAEDEHAASTVADPASARREYDEQASAEVVPGAGHSLHDGGEGDGSPLCAADTANRTDQQAEDASRSARLTLPSQDASRLGTSEDADAANTVLLYYTALLEERLASLFECQKPELYWETTADYRTIHKTADEHRLILQSGCYDVSARLLEENLTVSDGWVIRKAPSVIVKMVDAHVLGFAVADTGRAAAVYRELVARPGWDVLPAVRHGSVVLLSEELLGSNHLQTAARLIIACTANPELFADIDAAQALQRLSEEETGHVSDGALFFQPEMAPPKREGGTP